MCGMWNPRPGFNSQRVPDHGCWLWASWLILTTAWAVVFSWTALGLHLVYKKPTLYIIIENKYGLFFPSFPNQINCSKQPIFIMFIIILICLISVLRHDNQELREYIDKLVVYLMDKYPGALESSKMYRWSIFGQYVVKRNAWLGGTFDVSDWLWEMEPCCWLVRWRTCRYVIGWQQQL